MVDYRRRNVSVEGLKVNVDRLKEYTSRLIVFRRNTKCGKLLKKSVRNPDPLALLFLKRLLVEQNGHPETRRPIRNHHDPDEQIRCEQARPASHPLTRTRVRGAPPDHARREEVRGLQDPQGGVAVGQGYGQAEPRGRKGACITRRAGRAVLMCF